MHLRQYGFPLSIPIDAESVFPHIGHSNDVDGKIKNLLYFTNREIFLNLVNIFTFRLNSLTFGL